jgi:hypothetical protein
MILVDIGNSGLRGVAINDTLALGIAIFGINRPSSNSRGARSESRFKRPVPCSRNRRPNDGPIETMLPVCDGSSPSSSRIPPQTWRIASVNRSAHQQLLAILAETQPGVSTRSITFVTSRWIPRSISLNSSGSIDCWQPEGLGMVSPRYQGTHAHRGRSSRHGDHHRLDRRFGLLLRRSHHAWGWFITAVPCGWDRPVAVDSLSDREIVSCLAWQKYRTSHRGWRSRVGGGGGNLSDCEVSQDGTYPCLCFRRRRPLAPRPDPTARGFCGSSGAVWPQPASRG